MITKQRMLSIRKWAASATKILLWEFTLLPTLIIIGWKLYRRTNKQHKKAVKVREVDVMKHKLCLHGLEVKNQAQLLNLAKGCCLAVPSR